MTYTDVDVETVARRIADRGQDALARRLRQAYADAAAAHADLISLDDEQIEAMVQSAVENADGLQWRRALAGVASEELGISVTEALTHPAVARAQALVGAPSYEQSLAELMARPVPPATSPPAPASRAANGSASLAAEPAAAAHEPAAVLPEPGPEPEPEPPAPEPEPEPGPEPPMPGPSVAAPQSVSAADSALPPTVEHRSLPAPEPVMQAEPTRQAAAEPVAEPADELETVEADDVLLELLPEPDPIEYETEVYDVEGSFTDEQPPPTLEPEPFVAPAAIEDAGHVAAEPAAATRDGAAAPTAIEEPDDEELVIPAIHLGGVANLPTKREGLGVRLSADGLDILQGENDIIGRLIWDEIEALEVPNLRARRRRHEPRARLVVRTPHGDASFDVPGISADELRDRVEPLVGLYGRH